MSNARETFPERLRIIREHQGLSQRALGELLGLGAAVAITAISRYETGRRVPSLERLDEIAEALGVEPKDLISWWPADADEGAAALDTDGEGVGGSGA